jgi:ribosomal protein S18 acetylase RimI-like enzyme
MNYINIKTNEEIKHLSILTSEIWHEYWPVILTLEQIDYMVEKFQSYNAIKNQLDNENYIYNIIEDNGIEKGYFGISIKDDYLFLSKLYIKKEFRNSGIGRKAFEKICEYAKQYKKTSIQLTVNKNNTNTIKAYIKWGFIQINSVVTDIGCGFVMDDYIMEYKL